MRASRGGVCNRGDLARNKAVTSPAQLLDKAASITAVHSGNLPRTKTVARSGLYEG